MGDMVDTCAAALYDDFARNAVGEEYVGWELLRAKDMWRERAVVVIEAIREPSQDMVQAGVDNLFAAADDDWAEDVTIIWKAMIDTILNPST